MPSTAFATSPHRWTVALMSLTSLMTVAALTACGSTATKTPTSSSSSTTSSSAARGPITSAALYSQLKAGAAGLTSAHIKMSIKAGTQRVLAMDGDETLAGGKLTAMNIDESVGAIGLTLRLVGGATYVKLPSNLNKSGKPWQKATKESKNPVLSQVASSMSSATQSASAGQYASFAAAGSLKLIGTEQVNGSPATHYSVIVDVAKVKGGAISPAMKKTLVKSGITKIPVHMWVNEQGVPVRVSEKFKIQGQVLSTDFTLTKLNEPVTITAPPASQVSTS